MTDLHTIRQAIATVRREDAEVARLCVNAGCPERAPEFISQGMPVHAVVRALAPTPATTKPAAPINLGGAFDPAAIMRELARTRVTS